MWTEKQKAKRRRRKEATVFHRVNSQQNRENPLSKGHISERKCNKEPIAIRKHQTCTTLYCTTVLKHQVASLPQPNAEHKLTAQTVFFVPEQSKKRRTGILRRNFERASALLPSLGKFWHMKNCIKSRYMFSILLCFFIQRQTNTVLEAVKISQYVRR